MRDWDTIAITKSQEEQARLNQRATDLQLLSDAGFDGAIIATALHHGAVPLAWIRRGCCC